MDQKKYIKDVLFAHVEGRNDIIVEKSTWGEKESEWSKRLWKKGKGTPAKDERGTLIKDIIFDYFGIGRDELIEDSFRDAVFGQGNEWKTITTLHSSSLCAFLHFCKVSKNNAIEIELSEGGQKKAIKFDKVRFEYQMPCVGEGKSSMDVVLQSEDNETILFLESKFSEYFSHSKFDKEIDAIDDYKEKFKDWFDGKPEGGWKITDSIKASIQGQHLVFDNKDVYDEGIKQIICHDFAIHNSNNFSDLGKAFNPAKINNYWFSEILYQFEDPEEKGFKPSQKFEEYCNSSKQVLQSLRKIEKKRCEEGKNTIQLHFNEEPLVYNKLFSNENRALLTDEVKTFYKYAEGE